MIVVHKLDHRGTEKIAYPGRLISRTETHLVLEACFAGEQMELGYVTLRPGDRFVEHFYANRWYNVFVIYDARDGAFKGWYCNITRPARINGDHIWAEDLALDYFVQPSGREFILDEEEFAALNLAAAEARQARRALAELQTLAARHVGPFDLNPTDRLKVETAEHNLAPGP